MKPHMNYHRDSRCLTNADVLRRMAAAGDSLTAMAKAIHTHKRHVRNFLVLNKIQYSKHTGAKRDKHPGWMGGRTVDRSGYVLIRSDRKTARRVGYILEHRMVMEDHLGRPLKKGEVVHHKNGDRSDNRIENLALFSTNGAHLRATISGQVPKWTEDGLRRMRLGILRSSIQRRWRNRAKSEHGVPT